MTAVEIAQILIWVFAGFIAGICVGVALNIRQIKDRYFQQKYEPVGILHVEDDDPDGTYLFLELSHDPSYLADRKKCVFNIEHNVISDRARRTYDIKPRKVSQK